MDEFVFSNVGAPLGRRNRRTGRKEEEVLFGTGVCDVAVCTLPDEKDELFTHTAYWDTKRPGKREAPHIVALREALDLEDRALDISVLT
jgi:hypothetical protein